MRDDKERIIHILEAINRIEKYSTLGRKAFENDELIQNWIYHHLQIIGEASRHLSNDFCIKHSEIPWRGIVGMRNILVHGYFKIDNNAVWNVVEKDLKPLKEKLLAIISEKNSNST